MKTKKFFSLFIFIILLFFVSIAHADDTDVSFDVSKMDPDFHSYLLEKFDRHSIWSFYEYYWEPGTYYYYSNTSKKTYEGKFVEKGENPDYYLDPYSRYSHRYYYKYEFQIDVWSKDYADGTLDSYEMNEIQKWMESVTKLRWTYPYDGIDKIEKDLQSGILKLDTLLQNLQYFPNLEYIRVVVASSKLTELNISNPKLEYLLFNSTIPKLNVSSPVLERVDYAGCQLTELNVSSTVLKELDCPNNQLTELDISKPVLERLHCENNQLTKLDASKFPNLKYLSCYGNHLTELDLSHNSGLDASVSIQKVNGLKVNATSRGFEVNFNDYISKIENIVPGSITGYVDINYDYNIYPRPIALSLYDTATGVAVFEEYPTRVRYQYDTKCPSNTIYMDVDLYNDESSVRLMGIANDFTEISDNHYFRSSGAQCNNQDYYSNGSDRVGLVADGNSRIILRAEANKPGYVKFSFKDDIGAKLEKISDRSEITEDTLLRCEQNTGYAAVAVLVAPQGFPHSNKEFPSDIFTVHIKFTADDGTTAEYDKNFQIEAAPVVLVHGLFGDCQSTFGKGIAPELKNMSFNVNYFNYNTYSIANALQDPRELNTKLRNIFNDYNKREIECTRADVVAFGLGGILVRNFLQIEKKNDGNNADNNWSTVSYGQGMIRSFVSIAAPFKGTPWADILTGIKKFPYLWQGAKVELAKSFLPINLLTKKNLDAISSFMSNKHVALEELTTTHKANNKIPDTVAAYAICGNIGGIGTVAKDFAMNTVNCIANVVDKTGSLILFLSTTAALELGSIFVPEAAMPLQLLFGFTGAASDIGTIWDVALKEDSVAAKVSDFVEDAISLSAMYICDLIFGGKANDLIIPCSSAKGGFHYSKVFTGMRYTHPYICQQQDVGHDIGSYLKYLNLEDEKFTPKDNTANSVDSFSAIADVKENSSSEAPADFDNMEFKFIEAMKLKISPSFISIPTEGTSKAKFSVTKNKASSYDVYCAVTNNSGGLALFKIPDTNGKGKNFEINVALNSQDIGNLKAFCFSHNPEDNDGTSIHISNTVSITAPLKQNMKDVKISYIKFDDGAAYFHNNYVLGTIINVNSEIPLKLYAVADDGTLYDISSPSLGTTYTVDSSTYNYYGGGNKSNPEVISLSNSGIVKGLKEGSVCIKATYNDYIASTWIYVNPELKELSVDLTPPNFLDFLIAKAVGGTSPYEWEISDGNLPEGVNFPDYDLNYDNIVLNSYYQFPPKEGNYDFTLKVTDATGASVKKRIKGTITKPKMTVTFKNGVLGNPYNRTIKLSGGRKPYSGPYINDGKLPDGLNFELDNSASQIKISGTPTKAGKFTFNMSFFDNLNLSDDKTFTIKITKPAISGTLTTSGVIKKSYSSELTVSGGTSPYTWTKSGALPTGLKITSADNKITLSGTPTKAGKFTFTLKATDKNNLYVSKKFTLKISPIFTGSLPASGKVKTAYTGTLTASKNTTAYTWTKSGTLPTGLKITSADNKITLSGTPTKAGKFTFTIKATDKNNLYVSKKFTVKILPIFTGSLAATGKVKTAYTGTLTASKNTTAYTWTKSGTLPTGLKLTTTDNKAKLSGTPTKAGKFTFTLKATDKNNLYVSKKFTVTIVKDSTTKAKADSVNSDIDKSKEDLTTKAPLQADSPGVDSSKNEILKTELNGVEFVTTELKVLSEDILWQGEGRDEDLVGVRANKPLTFIIENALSDMKVIIDDYKTEGIEIYEGSFTLPAEFVSDDFKVRVEDAVIETNELFISVEK